MIQSLMFVFLLSLLSLFSALNTSAIQSFSTSDSASIQREHFSNDSFFIDQSAAILTTRHESLKVTGLRLSSDDDEDTTAEPTLLFYVYALSFIVFIVTCSLYISQSAHFFVRKALQFSNLYSRFAHA